MALPQIHLRLRKHAKKIEGFAPYPHPDRKMQMLDSLVMAVAVVWPAMFIPQILEIYQSQNATSINIYSFLASSLMVMPWIAYGIVHREKAIWVSNVLWFVVYSLIAVGAYLYG